jgi:hypothetical protein
MIEKKMDINVISYFDCTHKAKGEMWYQSDIISIVEIVVVEIECYNF